MEGITRSGDMKDFTSSRPLLSLSRYALVEAVGAVLMMLFVMEVVLLVLAALVVVEVGFANEVVVVLVGSGVIVVVKMLDVLGKLLLITADNLVIVPAVTVPSVPMLLFASSRIPSSPMFAAICSSHEG